MKFFSGFIAGLALSLALLAGAASLTITTDVTQTTRLQAAFTDKLKPGCPDACRQATIADVKAWIITDLEAVVRNYEYQQQQNTITTQSFAPS